MAGITCSCAWQRVYQVIHTIRLLDRKTQDPSAPKTPPRGPTGKPNKPKRTASKLNLKTADGQPTGFRNNTLERRDGTCSFVHCCRNCPESACKTKTRREWEHTEPSSSASVSPGLTAEPPKEDRRPQPGVELHVLYLFAAPLAKAMYAFIWTPSASLMVSLSSWRRSVCLTDMICQTAALHGEGTESFARRRGLPRPKPFLAPQRPHGGTPGGGPPSSTAGRPRLSDGSLLKLEAARKRRSANACTSQECGFAAIMTRQRSSDLYSDPSRVIRGATGRRSAPKVGRRESGLSRTQLQPKLLSPSPLVVKTARGSYALFFYVFLPPPSSLNQESQYPAFTAWLQERVKARRKALKRKSV